MHYKNPIDCSNLHEKQNKIEIIEKKIFKKSIKVVFNHIVAHECVGALMQCKNSVLRKCPIVIECSRIS